MPVLNSSRESGGNPLQSLLTNKLQACRPKTGTGSTIIRIIPEPSPDGGFYPMVKSRVAGGYDFSALVVHGLAMYWGLSDKFSFISQPLGMPDLANVHQPVCGTFIRAKHRMKTGAVPAGLSEIYNKVFAKPAESSEPLSQCKEHVILQAVVLQQNGQKFEEPKPFQAVFLIPSAVQSINDLLAQAHEDGKDVFDPDKGYLVELSTLPKSPKEGRMMDLMRCNLLDQMALPAEDCQKLWVPWDQGLKLISYEEQFRLLVRAFGMDFMESLWGDEIKRACGPVAAPAATTAAAAPVAAAQPHAPVAEAPKSKTLRVNVAMPPAPAESEPEELKPEPVVPAAPKIASLASVLKGGKAPEPKSPEELMKHFQEVMKEKA